MRTREENTHVILGLDVGKKTDHTVLMVLERWKAYIKNIFGEKPGKPFYRLVHMDRLPLDTPHNAQIEHVAKAVDRVKRHYYLDPYLVVDATGIGQAYFDGFAEMGYRVYGISIHGGQEVTFSKRVYGVPKVDLTAALAVLLENGRLQIAQDLPGRDILTRELMTFSWKQTETGHFKFEHLKASDHDDTVLALQVAAWFGEKGIRELRPSLVPPGM